MKNVVKIDMDSEGGASGTGVSPPPAKKRTPVAGRKSRSGLVVSAARNPSRPPPTSVRLHEDELTALKAMAAASGARSLSDLIQRAVRDYVSSHGGFTAPVTLGAVDGVYGARINEDIVDLANLLRTLEFGLLRVSDMLPPGEETSELRRGFEDASRTLTRIAGRVAYRPNPKRTVKG